MRPSACGHQERWEVSARRRRTGVDEVRGARRQGQLVLGAAATIGELDDHHDGNQHGGDVGAHGDGGADGAGDAVVEVGRTSTAASTSASMSMVGTDHGTSPPTPAVVDHFPGVTPGPRSSSSKGYSYSFSGGSGGGGGDRRGSAIGRPGSRLTLSPTVGVMGEGGTPFEYEPASFSSGPEYDSRFDEFVPPVRSTPLPDFT